MHELPILRDIVAVSVGFAERAGHREVKAVDLVVGELRDLDPAWMQRYFAFAAAGSLAESATLRVTRSRALLRCRDCDGSIPIDRVAPSRPTCAQCASMNLELITGNELRIESIDVV
jgi:hydrogenase nickel incorporation protein HypA/HybF